MLGKQRLNVAREIEAILTAPSRPNELGDKYNGNKEGSTHCWNRQIRKVTAFTHDYPSGGEFNGRTIRQAAFPGTQATIGGMQGGETGTYA